MTTEDRNTVDLMRRYGGGFVSRLAECALHADENNLQKLKDAFPEYWHQYMAMGRRMENERILKSLS